VEYLAIGDDDTYLNLARLWKLLFQEKALEEVICQLITPKTAKFGRKFAFFAKNG